MRICILGKFPPIEGGVSHQTHLAAHELARRGHDVAVVTNAAQVEHRVAGVQRLHVDVHVGAQLGGVAQQAQQAGRRVALSALRRVGTQERGEGGDLH